MSNLNLNPTKAKSEKAKVNKKLIVGIAVSFIGIIVVLAYLEVSNANAAQERPAPATKVVTDKGSAREIADKKPTSSPTKKQKDKAEKEENAEAKAVTGSHIKDASLLDPTPAKKVNKSRAATEPKKEPVEEKKAKEPIKETIAEPKVKEEPKKKEIVELSRDQKISLAAQQLMAFKKPRTFNIDVSEYIDQFDKTVSGHKAPNVYQNNLYSENGELIAKMRQESKSEHSSEPSQNSSNNDNKNSENKNNEQLPYIVKFGQVLMAETIAPLNTDFKLPVMAEIWEPPLMQARLSGKFQWDEYEQGIVIIFKKMYFGDLPPITINAYGLDISTEETPLFDGDVDFHYWTRFFARASAAFALPFIDYVQTTSHVITDSGIVQAVKPVDSTTDRIIGGVANVAKEFLPDLQRNSQRKPTARLPDEYPLGIVFVEPIRELEYYKNEPEATGSNLDPFSQNDAEIASSQNSLLGELNQQNFESIGNKLDSGVQKLISNRR